jgi:hypothetical protein
MVDYYIYLIASLPLLHFGRRAPFSFARFLEACAGKISQEDIELLRVIPDFYFDPTQSPVQTQTTLEKWRDFEISLRNELVKIRASRRHLEPDRYLRNAGYSEPYISRLAMHVYRNPSLMEAEKILDEERWKFLEELGVGHFFDLDYLIVYGLKLLILEKWDRILSASKPELIEQTLGSR